jgi:hypothetical protein
MSFYCEKRVNKGRTDKICRFCEETIPKGMPHTVVPGECMQSSLPLCDDCYEYLEANGIDDIRELPEYNPDAVSKWRETKS